MIKEVRVLNWDITNRWTIEKILILGGNYQSAYTLEAMKTNILSMK